MKIVHVAKYYLPHLGGVEIHLKEISSLLVKLGHEVTIVTTKHDLKLADSTNYNGVKIVRIPDFQDEKNPSLLKIKTWTAIKKHRELFDQADIVHVHDVFWWIIPVFRLIRKKTFITFHGWETTYPVSFNAKIQRYLYSKLSLGSIQVGSWIQDFYFDKPDFVTYGGINPKRLTKSKINFKEEKTKNKKTIKLAFVGRLSQDNDTKKYIQLVNALKNLGKEVEIIWIGEGEFRKQCEKLGKVTGFVKNISKYLVGKDLVFASSYLSILEAQLTANNVCSFYSNELKKAYLESYPGSKFMLITNSIDSMIAKIVLLFDSPKSQLQFGMFAREFAKQQTWDKVLNLYLKLWRKVKI